MRNTADGPMMWDRNTPCASCPYRRDAPRGMWHPTEFTNLMIQDANVVGATFGCHEFNKRPPEQHRPCAGWLLDQKRRGIPNVRLRVLLGQNADAARCFNEANDAGLFLFDSIKEMVDENMKYMRRGRTEVKEYEIFRHTGQDGMIQTNTGLVVPAMTKKEAIRVARVKLGRGTYEAQESSAAKRREQAKREAEVRAKLGIR